MDIKNKLVDAFTQSAETGRCIESILGLRVPGKPEKKTSERIQRRNTLIQKLSLNYPGGVWEKSCRIADEIAKYPRGKHKKLFKYMESEGMRLPTSIERIYQILRNLN